MVTPPKKSIITQTLTLTLTLYDQNHLINMLIIKYTNSMDFWFGVSYGTLTLGSPAVFERSVLVIFLFFVGCDLLFLVFVLCLVYPMLLVFLD